MSYVVFKNAKEYGPRRGLEGPFHYPNGQVLYYDAKAGKYWDPRTDFYLEDSEIADLKDLVLDLIRK